MNKDVDGCGRLSLRASQSLKGRVKVHLLVIVIVVNLTKKTFYQKRPKMSSPCPFGVLLPRNFPHILEEIFLFLDYQSFKTCFEVCKTWRALIMSELVQRKAKDIFYEEIKEDEKKLVRAAREGRMIIITSLLSTNMLNINVRTNIDHYVDEDLIEEEYEYTPTPLFEAAKNGHMDIVRLLLDKGAKPNISDDYGESPLKAAAFEGYIEVVKLLIDRGADPNMIDDNRDSALHDAARMGHNDIIQLLLDIGANPNISNRWGDKPLHNAARHGNFSIVQLLLNIGADPNIKNDDGETPLYEAFQNEHNNVEHLLLENGARPNKEYYEQKLLMAIEEGNTRDVRNHLLSGVNINFDQSEPLKEAVRIGHKDIVVLLLSKGANPNPNMEHVYDESPLTIALELEEKDLAQILLDAGAVPNDEDKVKMEEWGCFQFRF